MLSQSPSACGEPTFAASWKVSHSPTPFPRAIEEFHTKRDVIRYHTGEQLIFKHFGPYSGLTLSQIRGGWKPMKGACVVLNIGTNKPTMIVILVTDILLYSIMLFGLLNFRRRDGDTSKLGRWLWRQVRWRRLALTVVLLIHKKISFRS